MRQTSLLSMKRRAKRDISVFQNCSVESGDTNIQPSLCTHHSPVGFVLGFAELRHGARVGGRGDEVGRRRRQRRLPVVRVMTTAGINITFMFANSNQCTRTK